MDHNKTYADLLEQLTHDLSGVETEESARMFNAQALQLIRRKAAAVREFYIGEFLNKFKEAVVRQGRAEMAACEKAINDAKLEADLGTVGLQARLETATAAGDQEAEHVVWREREERQTACQAKVDVAKRRLDSIGIRLASCEDLASALGFDYT